LSTESNRLVFCHSCFTWGQIHSIYHEHDYLMF
jgi:hypothetical protein